MGLLQHLSLEKILAYLRGTSAAERQTLITKTLVDKIQRAPFLAFEADISAIRSKLDATRSFLESEYKDVINDANKLPNKSDSTFLYRKKSGPYWLKYYRHLINEHARRRDRKVGERRWPESEPKEVLNFSEDAAAFVVFPWKCDNFSDTTPDISNEILAAQRAANSAWKNVIAESSSVLNNAITVLDARLLWLHNFLRAPRPEQTATAQEAVETTEQHALDAVAAFLKMELPALESAEKDAVIWGLKDVLGSTATETAVKGENGEALESRLYECIPGLQKGPIISDEEVDEDGRAVVEEGLSWAWNRFKNEYVKNFDDEQEAQRDGKDLWERLNSGERVPRDEIPDFLFGAIFWPHIVRGRLRLVMDYDGVAYVRQARTGEQTPRDPFKNWAFRSQNVGKKPLTKAATAGLSPSAQERRYLDWTPLPHRAINPPRDVGTTTHKEDPSPHKTPELVCQTLDFSLSNLTAIREELIVFASNLRGQAVQAEANSIDEWARREAVRHILFEDVLNLPGLTIIERWLQSLNDAVDQAIRDGNLRPDYDRKAFGIAASVDHSGFISICMSVPGPLVGLGLVENTPEALAISMAHIVKHTVDREAVGHGGPHIDISRSASNDEAFAIHSALIRPVPTELVGLSVTNLQDVSRKMLETTALQNATVMANDDTNIVQRGGTIFEAKRALVELSARFGRVLDQNIPYLGGVPGSKPLSVSTTGLTDHPTTHAQDSLEQTGTQDVYDVISGAFNTTSFLLGIAFLVFCFFPSLDFVAGAQLNLSEREFKFLAIVFCILCAFRMYVAYGVSRIANQPKEPFVSRFGRWSRGAASLFFWSRFSCWLDLILFSTLSICFIYFDFFNLPKILADSTTDHSSFKDVLTKIVYALPAIGAGLLAQAITNLSATVTEQQEETGERVTLERLKWVWQSASNFNAQVKHIFGTEKESPVAAEFQKMLDRLPGYASAEVAVKSAETKIDALVEARRRGYLRSSAVTVAVVTFMAGLGPIKQMKPDGPADATSAVAVDFLMTQIVGPGDVAASAEAHRVSPDGADDSRYASLQFPTEFSIQDPELETSAPVVNDSRCPDPVELSKMILAKKKEANKSGKLFKEADLWKQVHFQRLILWCQQLEVSRAASMNTQKVLEATAAVQQEVNSLREIVSGFVGEGSDDTERQVRLSVLVNDVVTGTELSLEEFVRSRITDGNGFVDFDAKIAEVRAPNGESPPEYVRKQITDDNGAVTVPLTLNPVAIDLERLTEALAVLRAELSKPDNEIHANLNVSKDAVETVLGAIQDKLEDARGQNRLPVIDAIIHADLDQAIRDIEDQHALAKKEERLPTIEAEITPDLAGTLEGLGVDIAKAAEEKRIAALPMVIQTDLEGVLQDLEQRLRYIRPLRIEATIVDNFEDRLKALREGLETADPLVVSAHIVPDLKKLRDDLKVIAAVEVPGKLSVPLDKELKKIAAYIKTQAPQEIPAVFEIDAGQIKMESEDLPPVVIDTIVLPPDVADMVETLKTKIAASEPIKIRADFQYSAEQLLDDFKKDLGNAIELNGPPKLTAKVSPNYLTNNTSGSFGANYCKPIANFYFQFGSRQKIDCADFVWSPEMEFKLGLRGGFPYSEAPRCVGYLQNEGASEKAPLKDSVTASIANLDALFEDTRFDWISDSTTDSGEQVLIVGYADSTGTRSANRRLAQDRAYAVETRLDPERKFGRMYAFGRGEEAFLPDAPSGVLVKNPLSRRVDVLHCKPGTQP